MLEKMIILLLISAQLLWTDRSMLKKASSRELLTYTATLLVAGYLAFIFLFEKDWLNFNDIIDLIFQAPAEHIVDKLKAPS